MSSLDIVNLIENNPITKLSGTYNCKFLKRINEEFTETQHQLFIASFYCYMNYNKNTDFVVNLDNIWEWLGFTQKVSAKRVLEKNFTIDKDYKSSQLDTQNRTKEGRGGGNKEIIMLNIKTFKLFCIKAETSKAREIHEYFIKLEELLHDIIQEESDELKLQIQSQNEKNQELETKNQELKDNLEKTQNDQEFNKIALSTIPYIYIYNLDTTVVAPAIPKLKIGYSTCLQKRIRPFNTTCTNGKLVFSQEVKYLNDIADPTIKEKELRKLEVSVHSKLSHLFHADKEVFQVDIEEAKFCIVNEYNCFKLFMNPNKLDRQLKLKKMYEFSNSIINDEPENRVSTCDSSAQTDYYEVQPIQQPDVIHKPEAFHFKVVINGDPELHKKFVDFVESHCIVRGDVEDCRKRIQGAFKIHSRGTSEVVTTAFTEFLKLNFIEENRLCLQDKDQTVSGFRGIKVKDISYKKQFLVSNDEETFIFARCVFAIGKTKLFKDIFQEYQNWKQNMGKTAEKDDKAKLKKYLKDSPYTLAATVWADGGGGQGYYGIAFPRDMLHHRKTSSTGCVIERCDMNGDVLDTHDTIAKAATMQTDKLGSEMCAAKMSRYIENKTEVKGASGSYYFRKKA
jgi:phage anti-repressor protein